MSFPPPLAAALSGATVRQLAYWRRSTKDGPALLVPGHGSKPRVLYSFEDIVALRMFVKLRSDVSLQRIRKAVAWLNEAHPETHLSAHQLKAIKGEQTIVWISDRGDYFDVVRHPGERGFEVVMQSIFGEFRTERGRVVPDLSMPAQGIAVDREIRGGYPVAVDTRVPYSVLAGLAADGLDEESIRKLYPGVAPDSVAGAKQLAGLVADMTGSHHVA